MRAGGRQKGTPNKRTSDLRAKAAELGVDPFEILLLYAKRDWKSLGFESATVVRATSKGETFDEDRITAKMQMDAAAEACQYLEPKRKAIELSNDPENPIEPKLKVTPENMLELVQLVRGNGK